MDKTKSHSQLIDELLSKAIKLLQIIFLLFGLLVFYRVYNSYKCVSYTGGYLCRAYTTGSSTDYTEDFERMNSSLDSIDSSLRKGPLF